MNYYGNNDYRDYLAHYGILGMHWGIRRFQPYSTHPRKSGEGGKEVGEAKKTTGLIRRVGIRRSARAEKRLNNSMNFRNAKGFNQKASALIGNKRRESSARIDSQKESKLADASKTRIWKRVHETRSANKANMADYYAKKQKQSVGRKIFEATIVRSTFIKTPYQRLSGRKTTIGKEIANLALTGGIAGAVLDAKYLRTKVRDKKKPS